MLNILFVPGSFGTTIQLLVYRFSTYYVDLTATELNPINFMCDDGSMHKHCSTGHTLDIEIIKKFFNGDFDHKEKHSNLLIYAELGVAPSYDYKWFLEGINRFRKQDQTIYISIKDTKQAELCLLYQYNKKDTCTINGYTGFKLHDIFNYWGIEVENFTEKTQFELLDIFSDQYPAVINKWIDSNNYTDPSWLHINVEELLESTHDTFNNIINYCGGIFDDAQEETLRSFTTAWRERQQYVLDEYNLINTVVESILNGEIEYSPKMNFMAEAIILQKLKSNGYRTNGTI